MTDNWNLRDFDAKSREQEDQRQRAARGSWEKRAEYLRANGLPVPSYQPPPPQASGIGVLRPSATARPSMPETDQERSRVALASWQKRAEYLRANNLPVPAYQAPAPQTWSPSPSASYQATYPVESQYLPAPPGTGLVVAITLLFGLFGLIPAAIRSSRAETLGYSGSPYWKTFWWSLLLPVAFWIIVVAALS